MIESELCPKLFQLGDYPFESVFFNINGDWFMFE